MKTSNELAVYNVVNGGNGASNDADPWEKPNPRRGHKFRGHAIAFQTEFPVGKSLSQDTFGEWAEQRELLEIPKGLPKWTAAWQGFLNERNVLRYKINDAAAHPSLVKLGGTPFIIASVRPNWLEVLACDWAIARFEMARPVAGLVKAKQRKLGYLMQSADWTKLPPHMLTMGRMLWTDTSAFEQDVDTGSGRLLAKFKNFENMLQQVTVAQIGGND